MSELTESLTNILECENAVLDPDDVGSLVEILDEYLPPVYDKAPELLELLQEIVTADIFVDEEYGGKTELLERSATLIASIRGKVVTT